MAKTPVYDATTNLIEEKLQFRYGSMHPRAKITVYRYNAVSIRVRIVDSAFKGLGLVARENLVLPIVRELPENIQEQITMLLLLTPQESRSNLLSAEFDHPVPSLL